MDTPAIDYIGAFRDPVLARKLAAAIRAEVRADRTYAFMEFCGGHTHTIFKYGLPSLLPASIRLVHGPGCPVCVLPVARLDMAIGLAVEHGITLCSYGDMLRVPGSGRRSLLTAKAGGADVRMVYSAQDALNVARDTPGREVVFLAIGFETTTPPTAVVISRARQWGVKNFSVLCNHVLTPPAVVAIADSPDARAGGGPRIDGFIGPGHVTAVTGSAAYEGFVEAYRKPVVISGFEPIDLLESILMLVRQINAGRAAVEVQYTRAVTRDGNPAAQRIVDEVLEPREQFAWRGLGLVPRSGLRIRDAYAEFDAERRFRLKDVPVPEIPGCQCPAVLRGMIEPPECPLFGKACTPDSPVGACMVSSEGACAAYYSYRAVDRQDAV